MRKLPTYLTAIILTCTVPRVADFGIVYMHAWPVIAWAFSLVIALGVWASAYFTREHVTSDDPKRRRQSDQVRRQAGAWMLLFVIVDGGFNLLDVWLALPGGSVPVLQFGALVYGAFPTVASAALGSLQGAVDRLPAGAQHKYPLLISLKSLAQRRINDALKRPAKATKPAAAAEPILASSEGLFKCSRCEYKTDPADSDFIQQKRMAGHSSSHTRADARRVTK